MSSLTPSRLLLCVALVTVGAPIPAADRALLIGIDQYAHGIRALHGAKNDVADLRRLLRSTFGVPAAAIRTLTDAQATRAAILAAFDQWLIQGSAPGDRVFFQFSGHGYFIADQPGGDESGPGGDGLDELITAYDTRCRPSAGDPCGAPDNIIRDDELAARLDRLADRQVWLVVDSCHSGTMTRGGLLGGDHTRVLRRAAQSRGMAGPPPPPAVRTAHQREGGLVSGGAQRIALFAVAPNQEAEEDVDDPNRSTGLFTTSLVQGLGKGRADRNGDGRITYNELLDDLRHSAADYCRRHQDQCRSGVTPQLEIPAARLGEDALAFGRAAAPQNDRLDPATAEDLTAHSNEAGLALELLRDGRAAQRFQAGDLMAVRARARRAGYLLLFDLDAAGTLTQLYPDPQSLDAEPPAGVRPSGWVRAGHPVRIPDAYSGLRWRAAAPYGEGRMLAVLVEDEIGARLVSDPEQGRPMAQGPAAWLARLRERLNGLIHEADGGNRAVRWSAAAAPYRIDPAP